MTTFYEQDFDIFVNSNIMEYPVSNSLQGISFDIKIKIIDYIFTQSERKEFFTVFFSQSSRKPMSQMTENYMNNIMNVFITFQNSMMCCRDFISEPFDMFVFIDTNFDDDWISVFEYCDSRSYGNTYYRILFQSANLQMIEPIIRINGYPIKNVCQNRGIDKYSILRGDLEEEFIEACIRKNIQNNTIISLLKLIDENNYVFNEYITQHEQKQVEPPKFTWAQIASK